MGRAVALVFMVVAMIAWEAALAETPESVRIPFVDTRGFEQIESNPDLWIVEKGDNMWTISERHLIESEVGGPVAPYWQEVVEVNTPRVRSGDPDLIYPGEEIELPDINERR